MNHPGIRNDAYLLNLPGNSVLKQTNFNHQTRKRCVRSNSGAPVTKHREQSSVIVAV